MAFTEKYKNLPSSDHPATLIYLVDISGSMGSRMPSGKTRMEAVKDGIQVAYSQMIQRSLRQGIIRPQYRVGMIAYTDNIYDVYGNNGSIIAIDKLKDEGIPPLTPQKSTNMAKAFRYAVRLVEDDLNNWSTVWLEKCPPPMVINITDCEYVEETQDPMEFARQLQKISVPDGSVLVENIYITDQIILSNTKIDDWKGYTYDESTGDPFGDKLLTMSSPIPVSYANFVSKVTGIKIREGTAMMVPGISRDFIETGFALSVGAGNVR